jgi:hypothetical protein
MMTAEIRRPVLSASTNAWFAPSNSAPAAEPPRDSATR